MDEIHVCDPPMEQRPASAPTEWQCPECSTWWDLQPSVPPEVAPTYDSLTHQGIVPAKWVRRESGGRPCGRLRARGDRDVGRCCDPSTLARHRRSIDLAPMPLMGRHGIASSALRSGSLD